ncbi:hypothetical protein PVAP13_1KG096177 [Panicum virgatum]|uniref:Uncharacterized protein n=1 Tax=Panicum virgatum TaxID=38727 RepID=A0A8T0XMA7_PANVG|nr:hypothetical protein PVAP13_1KG096177 [Panicum virgatum]
MGGGTLLRLRGGCWICIQLPSMAVARGSIYKIVVAPICRVPGREEEYSERVPFLPFFSPSPSPSCRLLLLPLLLVVYGRGLLWLVVDPPRPWRCAPGVPGSSSRQLHILCLCTLYLSWRK